LLTLIIVLLSGCTPMVYGVREETWGSMSETERLQSIDAYRQRQVTYQRASEERISRQQLEMQRLQLLQADEEVRHNARIVAIYQHGNRYGDLLRIRLAGGYMLFQGRIAYYQPVVFTLSAGETRLIPVRSHNGQTARLQVAYLNGRLLIDGTAQTGLCAQLTFDNGWGSGQIYTGLFSRNSLRLQNVEAYVEIVDTRRHDLRHAKLPAIVVRTETRRRPYADVRGNRQTQQRPHQADNKPQRRDDSTEPAQQHQHRDVTETRRQNGREQEQFRTAGTPSPAPAKTIIFRSSPGSKQVAQVKAAQEKRVKVPATKKSQTRQEKIAQQPDPQIQEKQNSKEKTGVKTREKGQDEKVQAKYDNQPQPEGRDKKSDDEPQRRDRRSNNET
jgi:hypothetical protein